jgi:hypothetical protein
MPGARASGRGKKFAGHVAASEPLVATSLLSQAGARPSREQAPERKQAPLPQVARIGGCCSRGINRYVLRQPR